MEYQKVSDEDIDFMIERANAATSGPWAWNAPDEVCGTYAIYEAGEDDPPIIECYNWQEKENAMFISSARNCIVDLCMEIKEFRKQQKK